MRANNLSIAALACLSGALGSSESSAKQGTVCAAQHSAAPRDADWESGRITLCDDSSAQLASNTLNSLIDLKLLVERSDGQEPSAHPDVFIKKYMLCDEVDDPNGDIIVKFSAPVYWEDKSVVEFILKITKRLSAPQLLPNLKLGTHLLNADEVIRTEIVRHDPFKTNDTPRNTFYFSPNSPEIRFHRNFDFDDVTITFRFTGVEPIVAPKQYHSSYSILAKVFCGKHLRERVVFFPNIATVNVSIARYSQPSYGFHSPKTLRAKGTILYRVTARARNGRNPKRSLARMAYFSRKTTRGYYGYEAREAMHAKARDALKDLINLFISGTLKDIANKWLFNKIMLRADEKIEGE